MIYGAYEACCFTIYMQSETEIEIEMVIEMELELALERITIYDVI